MNTRKLSFKPDQRKYLPTYFNANWQEKLLSIKVSGKSIDGKPVSGALTPEELEDIDFGEDVVIPDDKKKAAFPIPWGFLVSCKVESWCSKPRIKNAILFLKNRLVGGCGVWATSSRLMELIMSIQQYQE